MRAYEAAAALLTSLGMATTLSGQAQKPTEGDYISKNDHRHCSVLYLDDKKFEQCRFSVPSPKGPIFYNTSFRDGVMTEFSLTENGVKHSYLIDDTCSVGIPSSDPRALKAAGLHRQVATKVIVPGNFFDPIADAKKLIEAFKKK